jgi:hypothetical protein
MEAEEGLRRLRSGKDQDGLLRTLKPELGLIISNTMSVGLGLEEGEMRRRVLEP